MFADPVFHELADQRSCTNDGSSRLVSLASMLLRWPPTSPRDARPGVRTDLLGEEGCIARSPPIARSRGVSFSTRMPAAASLPHSETH